MKTRRKYSAKRTALPVKFICTEKFSAMPYPRQAAHWLPDWYKVASPTHGNSAFGPSGPLQGTFKKCLPFLDAMSAGYIIPMWCDLAVSKGEDGLPVFNWYSDIGYQLIEDQGGTHGIPGVKDAYKLISPWSIETPPGVSCLITMPMNRPLDEAKLRFWSGIIETDNYNAKINFPFTWHGPDEDVILAGTPIAQVIPFVRNRFDIVIEPQPPVGPNRVETEVSEQHGSMIRSVFEGAYRNTFWRKKEWVS